LAVSAARKASKGGGKKGRGKVPAPDPRQRLLPLPGILPDEELRMIQFRKPARMTAAPDADDPRTLQDPHLAKAFAADFPVYRGGRGGADKEASTRRCGASWGLEFEGDEPTTGRAYSIVFEPEPEHLKRLYRPGAAHDRASVEKEALRLRTVVRLPLKQYVLEDGDLVSVYEFSLKGLRWELRWRQDPEGTVEDRGEKMPGEDEEL
jgi:hypothetical protein